MKTRERLSVVVAVALLVPLAVAAAGDANELALIDDLVAARAAYEKSLRDLVSFYSTEGQTMKYFRASEELREYGEIAKRDYMQMGSPIKPPSVKQVSHKGADILYEDALLYKTYPDLLTKKKKLVKAIDRFKLLLRLYPDSDKADDACFMLGEIYEGFYFQDSFMAAGYYDQAVLINPNTPWPAFYRAALIYYKELPSPEKAAERFRKVIEYSLTDSHKRDAVRKIERLKADKLIKN